MLIDEDTAKSMLVTYGIPRPYGLIIPPDRMSTAYRDVMKGPRPEFPLVVKVLGTDIAHKMERGGVRTCIKDEYQLVHAIRDFRHTFPGCGILVEEFVPHFIEFIVGVEQDETFGPVVMFGAGGVLTELYADVAFRCLPVDEEDVLSMVLSTKVGEMFIGYRGMELDPGPLVDAIMGIVKFAQDREGHVGTVEVNPLAWTDDGVVAIDAKVDIEIANMKVSQEDGTRGQVNGIGKEAIP